MRTSFPWSVSVKRTSFLLLSQLAWIYSRWVTAASHQNCIQLALPVCGFCILSWGKTRVCGGKDPENSEKQNLYVVHWVSVRVLEPIPVVLRRVQIRLYFHFFPLVKKEPSHFVVFRFLLFVRSFFLLSLPLCLSLSVSPFPLEGETGLWVWIPALFTGCGTLSKYLT